MMSTRDKIITWFIRRLMRMLCRESISCAIYDGDFWIVTQRGSNKTLLKNNELVKPDKADALRWYFTHKVNS